MCVTDKLGSHRRIATKVEVHEDVRCTSCGRKLFESVERNGSVISIKCPKCGSVILLKV